MTAITIAVAFLLANASEYILIACAFIFSIILINRKYLPKFYQIHNLLYLGQLV